MSSLNKPGKREVVRVMADDEEEAKRQATNKIQRTHPNGSVTAACASSARLVAGTPPATDQRHFLMLMHESMGEFLADDVRAELHPSAGDYDRIAHQVFQQVLDATMPTMLPHGQIDRR